MQSSRLRAVSRSQDQLSRVVGRALEDVVDNVQGSGELMTLWIQWR